MQTFPFKKYYFPNKTLAMRSIVMTVCFGNFHFFIYNIGLSMKYFFVSSKIFGYNAKHVFFENKNYSKKKKRIDFK